MPLPDRHRRLTGLQRFLATVGLGGMTMLFAVLAAVRLVFFAVDREIEDLLWGLVAVILAAGFYWWYRREVRTNLWKRVAPLVAVAMPLSLAVAVGTSDTTLAACSTPGEHWHWRSSTDKFKSTKAWTNCFSTNNGADGQCTSWYDARNYTYYCSPDITYHCVWKYTGTISRHHSHKCIW